MARFTNRQLIRELRKFANFHNAGFGQGHEKVTVTSDFAAGATPPVDVTDFIKERTRLYRETWLLPLIDLAEKRLCRK